MFYTSMDIPSVNRFEESLSIIRLYIVFCLLLERYSINRDEIKIVMNPMVKIIIHNFSGKLDIKSVIQIASSEFIASP